MEKSGNAVPCKYFLTQFFMGIRIALIKSLKENLASNCICSVLCHHGGISHLFVSLQWEWKPFQDNRDKLGPYLSLLCKNSSNLYSLKR